MIPKVIHYCWFGGTPLPESARKCIASWCKFLPDYEIKEWNESNFDINSTQYTREAYSAKKYAFVSDYARFWVLFHYGGLYFDTDVEVIKPMTDIIERGNFMGREIGSYMRNMGLGEDNGYAVNPGLGFGIEKGSPLIKEILDNYNRFSFINPNGTFNLKTIVKYTTEVLGKHGLTHNNTEFELVGDIWIYPADYFCPMDHTRGNVVKTTDRTVSIHHYDSSWNDYTAIHHILHLFKNWLMRTFGPERVQNIIDIFNRKK